MYSIAEVLQLFNPLLLIPAIFTPLKMDRPVHLNCKNPASHSCWKEIIIDEQAKTPYTLDIRECLISKKDYPKEYEELTL